MAAGARGAAAPAAEGVSARGGRRGRRQAEDVDGEEVGDAVVVAGGATASKRSGGAEAGAVVATAGQWTPRPLEPVVANGRGMHVLGFMPLGGLQALALATASASNGGTGSGGRVGGKGLSKVQAPDEAPGAGAAVPGGGPAGRRRHDGHSSLHGNYHSYYAYRHQTAADVDLDRRLSLVTARLGAETFRGKEVLDIGCNAGEVSLAVARRLGARRVVGVDIDDALIEMAEASRDAPDASQGSRSRGKCEIEFRAEDFVCSPMRRLPDGEPERFDVILCLSVTKWVHFSRGDAGVQKLFRRVYRRLRPGGIFILEPQEWKSYQKKRRITPEISKTVAGIEMRPEAFDEYLLGLGFERVDTIAPPSDGPRGFQRSIRVFVRPEADEEDVDEVKAAPPPAQARKVRRHSAAGEEEGSGEALDVKRKGRRRDACPEVGAAEWGEAADAAGEASASARKAKTCVRAEVDADAAVVAEAKERRRRRNQDDGGEPEAHMEEPRKKRRRHREDEAAEEG